MKCDNRLFITAHNTHITCIVLYYMFMFMVAKESCPVMVELIINYTVWLGMGLILSSVYCIVLYCTVLLRILFVIIRIGCTNCTVHVFVPYSCSYVYS